mgnify:CR=1 FL=1
MGGGRNKFVVAYFPQDVKMKMLDAVTRDETEESLLN